MGHGNSCAAFAGHIAATGDRQNPFPNAASASKDVGPFA